jgi:hypothetical protein
MTGSQKMLIGTTGTLLMAFIVFGICTWIRVVESIPYSTGCATTLVQISRQSATARLFFLGVFVIGVVVFELSRRQFSTSWRFVYLVILGLAAALLVAPRLIDLLFLPVP